MTTPVNGVAGVHHTIVHKKAKKHVRKKVKRVAKGGEGRGSQDKLDWMNLKKGFMHGGPLGACRAPRVLTTVAILAAALVVAAGPANGAAGESVVAKGKRAAVAVYRFPGARRAMLTVRSPAFGVPVVFLVKQQAEGWEQVYLPKRPNGSTGWVRDSAVELYRDPYRVEVSLSNHLLSGLEGATQDP